MDFENRAKSSGENCPACSPGARREFPSERRTNRVAQTGSLLFRRLAAGGSINEQRAKSSNNLLSHPPANCQFVTQQTASLRYGLDLRLTFETSQK